MKILVMDETAKVYSVECESTDTIAHLNEKLGNIKVIRQKLMFDGKQLNDSFLENMMLVDVGVQDRSLILHAPFPCSYQSSSGGLRRPENDYLHYADAFKSGWREEHAKALLQLLLEFCQDGTIYEGNVTDEAWLRVQNNLKNSMKCSFEIEFLKERLHDYKNLYSVLANTTSSSIFKWDSKRNIITIEYFYNWREEYPELLLLCGPHITYFDTLKEVCLLVNTTQSSEQRVSETSTNINSAREASSSRGDSSIQCPSESNLSPVGSSTSIGKGNGYLPSTLKILVLDETGEAFYVECESTDTIAHLNAKLGNIKDIRRKMMSDDKLLNDNFLENMMLVDVGVQDGSLILQSPFPRAFQPSSGRLQRPENDYLHYADAFKSGWREEHAKALLQLLLEFCQDGTIYEGNVTDEAWLRVQNSLKNSMKCSFEIDFLKERLHDYKNLYSVLANTTRSSIFKWDSKRNIITIDYYNWREEYPELLLLCGPHITYFDTLKEVCLLLNTTQSSEQRASETSTNINNAWEASSSRGEICIRCPSDSNLSPVGSSTSIGKGNGYLPSTLKILVVDETAKVYSVECESTDTIAHLNAKLGYIKDIRFDGKKLNHNFYENMVLVDAGFQDGSMILHSNFPRAVPLSGLIERPRRSPRIPENDYLHYADAFKSGWREEHAKALLHLLLELCQDGTISEGNVTDEAWLRIQNNLKNSMKCSFEIDFLKERLHDYKNLYSVLAETSSSIFKWDRERKKITSNSNWREQYPELLLLCGPYVPYFDTLEEVCLLLNTGQTSEHRVPESSTNISTMHGEQVRQDIPRHSKLRSLFHVLTTKK